MVKSTVAFALQKQDGEWDLYCKLEEVGGIEEVPTDMLKSAKRLMEIELESRDVSES